MGRPRNNNEAFGIRMERQLHYRLQVQSSIEGVSGSSLIARLVEEYLDKQPLTEQVTRKAVKKISRIPAKRYYPVKD